MAKVKFTNIGTVMVAKKKDPNNEDEAPRYYIKLQQNKQKDGTPYGDLVFPITLANGKVLKDGDMLSLFSKKEKFNAAVEAGTMSQEKADELSAFIKFDVCVGEDTEEKSDSKPNKSGVDF